MTRRLSAWLLLIVFASELGFPLGAHAQNPGCPNPTGTGINRYVAQGASGSGLNPGAPANLQAAIGAAQPGDVIHLTAVNGSHYTGSANMMVIPDLKSGTQNAPITICADNDGEIWVDGQFTNIAFHMVGSQWWVFNGFDVSNTGGGGNLMSIDVKNIFNIGGPEQGSNNNVFRRICAWNANPHASANPNAHVWAFNLSNNNLLEDICGFGYGRNTLIEYEGRSHHNTVRRAWLSWNGWNPNGQAGNCGVPSPSGPGHNCESPGPQWQTQYLTPTGNSLYENIITVFNPFLQIDATFNTWDIGSLVGSGGSRDAAASMRYLGFIAYGYDGWTSSNQTTLNHSWISLQDGQYDTRDIFVDARSQPQVSPLVWTCRLDANGHPLGLSCSDNHGDRTTVLRGASTSNLVIPWGSQTNFNECTATGGNTGGGTSGGALSTTCPNVYTGTTSGSTVGSRACFRYQNGGLSATPLWPWPMDDRIKQARSRAGHPALAGVAGPGYAANTVTSEIVARYGAVPSQCLSAAVPTLSVAPSSITFNATVGGTNPTPEPITISDLASTGTMAWTVSDNATWLTVSPASGTGNGNPTASVSLTGLAAGTFNATITVTATGAVGSPVTIPVTLNLTQIVVPATGQSGRVR